MLYRQRLMTVIRSPLCNRYPVSWFKVRRHVVRIILRIQREGFGRDDFTGYTHFEGFTGIVTFDLAVDGIDRAFGRTIIRHGLSILLDFLALLRIRGFVLRRRCYGSQ